MSNLVDHAEYELRRAGMFDADSDYDGLLGQAVLKLVKAFAGQGHSGMSARRTLQLFNIVANFKTLTPITSDPAEWNDVSAMSGEPMWQNRRASSCFSKDGGKTHYDLDANDGRAIRTTAAP